MLLSARILRNLCDVNTYEVALAQTMTEGDSNVSIYLQLIDTSADRALQGFSPAGRRYIPATGSSLIVTLDSLDDARKLVRTAVQPFVGDASIWRVDLLTSDNPKGTVSLRLKLTSGPTTLNGILVAGLLVSPP